ncbi:MAG TPA: sensor histidine kinase [Gaiellaceae bacterium]|nr:sensor histidine kinase [Gaiellaceae bacterium]
MQTIELDHLLVEARQRLSGRTGTVALISLLTVATVAEAALTRNRGGPDAGRGEALVLLPLAVVPLLITRRRPTVAAVIATLLTVALLGVHQTPLTVLPFCVLLFTVVQLVTRGGLAFAVPLLVPFVINTGSPLDGDSSSLSSALPLLLLLAALVVGESMRKRGLAVAALDATQEAMAESSRLQTAMEERARIARELHDIVAHHLSVITVESEAARLTSPKLSKDAVGRFEAIASTAREALTETRRLLGVLRDDSAVGADRAPQPGLDVLDELIGKAQASGTPIRLVREGTIARLPLGVDLAAYRIVQEALTNARRHAPGANVDVELSYRDGSLHLHIRDYGPGTLEGAVIEGHGLMGMRERAMLARGSFAAGPADGGGFEVVVSLPATEETA